ncbi:MAG: hypothetical protein LBQ78_03960, partial [Tannerellaceae bacterium]|nr:hypothetical protein [Tannerellaceae bacterium]
MLKKMMGNDPSVRRFKQLLAGLSGKEQKRHYYHAYRVSMQGYEAHPKKYKAFFVELVKHDWQQFADYIHSETVLGALLVPVDDPKMFKKISRLIVQHTTNPKISYNHFSFCLLLVFRLSVKVRVLSDQLRDSGFYPEEILELLR